jgi:gas vesicle protein
MNTDRIYYSREAEMHAAREMTKLTVLFLTMGLGIGAVLALLFAPASGKKIRENLAKGVGEGLNNSHETIEPVVKRLEKEFGDLRKSVEERLK